MSAVVQSLVVDGDVMACPVLELEMQGQRRHWKGAVENS